MRFRHQLSPYQTQGCDEELMQGQVMIYMHRCRLDKQKYEGFKTTFMYAVFNEEF